MNKNKGKEEKIVKLSKELNVSKLLAEIYLSKGIDSKKAYDEFVNPDYNTITDPFLYTNVKEVVNRIKVAIKNNEKVVIYGDYDVDGICSVSILYDYLRSKGLDDVAYFIPTREMGYGLSVECLENIAETFFPDLIITVDCGIASYEEVQYAHEVLGIDVIVTDHHEIPDKLPECLIFNPKLDEGKLFSGYAGCGVVQRLVAALEGEKFAKKYIDLVALATISDVMPLIKDNRTILIHAFRMIDQKKANPAIYFLYDSAKKITSDDIGFNIAPKLNALGRLEDASLGVRFLVEADEEERVEIAKHIEGLNQERKKISQDAYEFSLDIIKRNKLLKNRIIVVNGKNIQQGVLGIVASRLTETLKRPVIVLRENKDDLLTGSGRSVGNINLYEVIKKVEKYLEAFGGHAQACGVTVSKLNFDLFAKEVEKVIRKEYKDDEFLQSDDDSNVFKITEKIDENFIKELKKLEPFGYMNENVYFSLPLREEEFEYLGKNKKHLKLSLNDNKEIVAFGMGDRFNAFNADIPKVLKGKLSVNVFLNKKTLQFLVEDLKFLADDYIFDINSNLVWARYFYTAIKEKKSTNKKIITLNSMDELERIVEDSLFNTVFLTYTKETYINFLEYLKKNKKLKDKVKFYNFAINKNPYNSLVLFPDEEAADLSLYDNIIFLDRPLSLFYYSAYNIKRDAKIFTLNLSHKIMKEKIVSCNLTRERLGKIYLTIDRILKTKDVYSISSLYNEYKKEKDALGELAYYLGFYIFADLGLVEFTNKGLKFKKNKRTKLEQSSLYKKILEMHE